MNVDLMSPYTVEYTTTQIPVNDLTEIFLMVCLPFKDKIANLCRPNVNCFCQMTYVLNRENNLSALSQSILANDVEAP